MEGLVGYARRNFMVPVPRVPSWDELNAQLLGECWKRRERKLWGHAETIAERFEQERGKLLPLPPTPLEACDKRTSRVSSQALVRYETNDYSAPTEYGHRQVLVKAFVWEVVIGCSSEIVARHARSYGREEMIFNPLHYLALLEQKTNALDQAAPLQALQAPEEFKELRRQMEARLGKHAGNTASDLFVTKIDPSGNITLPATLSGKGSDQANGIAVDAAGNIYVAGSTTSPDFPLFNPAPRL